jgi:bacteriorhodopsin
LIFGLIGSAVGATSIEKFSSFQTISRIDVAIVICGAFFSFAAGSWVAAKITGARHSERTILHAAIAWLVATPLLVVMWRPARAMRSVAGTAGSSPRR